MRELVTESMTLAAARTLLALVGTSLSLSAICSFDRDSDAIDGLERIQP